MVALRAKGKGWQTELNAFLSKALARLVTLADPLSRERERGQERRRFRPSRLREVTLLFH
jgi:hypothetical protein